MLIVFLLPIYQNILSPVIGIWILTSLLSMINKPKFNLNLPLISLIFFYVILVFGLLWTENLKAGTFDLEVKMSIFIFPFLFMFINYTKRNVKFIFYSFILGILISAIVLVFKSTQNYLITHLIDSYFYINLSNQIHPSYLSYYVLTALLIILIDMKYKVFSLFSSDVLSICISLLLIIFNLMLLSKIGVACSLVIILIFLIDWMVKKKKYIPTAIIISIIISILYISYQKSSYVNTRTNELVNTLTQNKKNNPNSSTGIRLQIWNEGLYLIKDKPIFGYGTGDVKDVLMQQYKAKQIDRAYNLNLNAHNQFIQISIAVGLIGLLIFLSAFYWGIKLSVTQNNYFLLAFIILSIIFMLPESMLENQAGTISFSLFFSLLNQNIYKTS